MVEPVDRIRLSVVVPVHNESGNIEPLYREITEVMSDGPAWEALFVDDGSSDDGVSEMDRLCRSETRFRLIRLQDCCGQSTALIVGVRQARGDWIITLDGDGQNDPADIPKLLAAAEQAGDPGVLVIGHRTRRHDSGLRRLSSKWANGVRSRMLGDNTPDSGCGLKVFRRDMFLELPYFDHMHRFLPALFQRAGGSVHSVAIGHRPRVRGRSKYGVHNRLWVGIVDLFGVRWLMRRSRVPVGREIEG